ncbi:MAG: hypothetical protein LBS62_05530 [Clostridiales bacterium]|jgi:hypothetical protein|nr:hypothetical protein [Clostridiales bacterium]
MEISLLSVTQTIQLQPAAQDDGKRQGSQAAGQQVSIEMRASVLEVSQTQDNDAKVDRALVDKLIKESEERTASFRKLVEGLLSKQANKNAIANGTSSDAEYASLLSKIYNNETPVVEIDEATRAKAQEDISEDGYYGVKQTSQRILDFAKAISGGDASKIELLRGAVDDGFKAAEEAWGSELPQISKDTYEAVMKGFDEWQASAVANKTSDEVSSQIAAAAGAAK